MVTRVKKGNKGKRDDKAEQRYQGVTKGNMGYNGNRGNKG